VVESFIRLVLLLGLIGLVSIVSAWALSRGYRPATVVLLGSSSMALLIAALFLIGQLGQKEGFEASLHQYFENSGKQNEQWMAQSHWTPENIAYFKTFFQKYITMAFPAWLALNSLIVGFLGYYLSSAVLSRTTKRVPRAKAFREWVVPEPLIFGLIAAGLLKLYAPDNSWREVVGNNLLVFFGGLYILGGLSIASFFLTKWRLPRVLRFLSYIVLLMTVWESICAIGVMDVWLDFRKIKKSALEGKPS